MRRLLTALLLLAAILPIWAASISHPSMLFTPQRIEEAKKMIKTDPARDEAWKSILSQADALLEKNDIRKMEYLALAYQMTGDKRYGDKLRTMLLDIAKTPSWADAEMMMRNPSWRSELQMAHKSFQIAVAYDAIYNMLTPKERKEIAQGVWRLAGEPLLGDWLLDDTRIHSLNSMGHNWWTSCVGMGGLLALSISNEVPEAAEAAKLAVESLPEWFAFEGDEIQGKPRTFDRDGGMYESINYASFGITEALLLRIAWLNSHPGDKLPEIDQMKLLPSFFSHVCYPRDGMLYSINFGDSHKNVTGESSMALAYAMGVKDPVTLWYITQLEPNQHREGFPLDYPMGLLYLPDVSNAPSTPALPTSHLWKDFGWATMRDSWKKDATMLAVKSGMTWNHAHADANSLILFHKGVDIIKDAGNCSYGKPEYRNYFFQSDAHNVVKFNGEGQPRAQQYHGSPIPGNVSSLLDAGCVKYVMANGTGPMSRWFSRNIRHYLWIGDVIYIVDDIVSHEPGKFEWLWHPGGEVRKRGGDLEITSGESSVILRPLYPEPLAPSNFVHDYPDMLWWEVIDAPKETLDGTEQYYSLHLPKVTDRVKGVTAIILKDTPDQKELPDMARIEGKDWIGVRSVYGGKVTDLYINQLADGRLMHLNSWIDAEGWSTDAYMLAVTYDEDSDPAKSSEVTLIHGGTLKRDGHTYHSSRTKSNVVGKISGGKFKPVVTDVPVKR
ncbi:MAG: heparinase II/III family protein [Muribaculaceae bacterium]|nr:heparinase II/III family protein [Muribaculaceae bacterium]